MSSNSSATRRRRDAVPARTAFNIGPVADLLDEALRAVRAQVPPCYEAARISLARKVAQCRIDEEIFIARVTSDEIVLESSSQVVDISVEVSRRTILALVRNEQSLSASVLSGALKVRGTIADASALGRAMKAFLHGAVRSPALPAILVRFEQLAKRERE